MASWKKWIDEAAEMRPETFAVLDKVVADMKEVNRVWRARLEGHMDKAIADTFMYGTTRVGMPPLSWPEIYPELYKKEKKVEHKETYHGVEIKYNEDNGRWEYNMPNIGSSHWGSTLRIARSNVDFLLGKRFPFKAYQFDYQVGGVPKEITITGEKNSSIAEAESGLLWKDQIYTINTANDEAVNLISRLTTRKAVCVKVIADDEEDIRKAVNSLQRYKF